MFSWIEKHPVVVFLGIIGLYGVYWFVIPRCFDDHPATVSNVPKAECSAGEGAPLADVTPTGRTKGLIPWDKSGVFGDSFGALTCLFSALTFWAMLYALMYQRRQMKDARDSIAKEHLPLLLIMPESGLIEFRFGEKTGCLILVIRIKVREENSSDNAALDIVHHSQINLPLFKGTAFHRGVDTSNFMRTHKEFTRHEEFTLADKTEILQFLTTLIAYDQKDRPELVLNRVYKCFLEACAEMNQSYRIKLLKHKVDEPKIRDLIQMMNTEEGLNEDKISLLLGGVLTLDLECKPIHEKMIRRSCSCDRYNQFVREYQSVCLRH